MLIINVYKKKGNRHKYIVISQYEKTYSTIPSPYRYGVAMMDVPMLDEGTYIAIISTFQPKQIVDLNLQCVLQKMLDFNCPLQIAPQ